MGFASDRNVGPVSLLVSPAANARSSRKAFFRLEFWRWSRRLFAESADGWTRDEIRYNGNAVLDRKQEREVGLQRGGTRVPEPACDSARSVYRRPKRPAGSRAGTSRENAKPQGEEDFAFSLSLPTSPKQI